MPGWGTAPDAGCLAARMQASGHKVRNSYLTAVLHTLRSETTTPPPNPPKTAA